MNYSEGSKHHSVPHTQGHVDMHLRDVFYPDVLPPTPTSEHAEMLLHSFGIPQYYSDQLRNLTAQFRYDKCMDRCIRISTNPAYYVEYTDGSAQIVLRSAEEFDTTTDGQCGNLAMKWIRSIHTTGWLNEVNSYLIQQKKPILHPVMMQGYAKTHFTGIHDNHVWAGLTPISTHIEPRQLLLVDPAFQLISTHEESAYRIRNNDVCINPTFFNEKKAKILDVGELDLGMQTFTGSLSVIGISSDFTVLYSVGYCHLRHVPLTADSVFPVLYLANSEKMDIPFVYVNNHAYFAPNFPLSDSVKAEAVEMYKILYDTNLQIDYTAAASAAGETGVIRW